MTILSATNAQWANASNTAIDLDVVFSHLPQETVRFTATPNDSVAYGRELYESATAGAYGAIADYVAIEVPVNVPNITVRQFLIAAAVAGFITQAEAIAAAKDGSVPSAIATLFSNLPPEEQFAAAITWAKMTIIDRNEPLAIAVATQFGLTSSQIDAFFISAAAI